MQCSAQLNPQRRAKRQTIPGHRSLLVLMSVAFLGAITCFGIAPSAAWARDCGEVAVSAVVDRTGVTLRQANAKSQPELQAKFQRLAELKGWPKDRAVERAYGFVRDERTTAYDTQASQLLIRFNELGDASKANGDCTRLDELEKVARQLIEVSAAKTAHVSAKLAAAIRESTPAGGRSAAASPPPRAAPAKTPTEPARPPRRPPTAAPTGPWTTTTERAPWPKPEVMAQLPRLDQLQQDTFSAEEIRAAGRGLFGTLSAEIASIIEFTFSSYGSPSGYILGTEGGAAFLAGLRYGEGRLVTKRQGASEIHWQGPSVGYDFGLAGSRVMFLVYNLREPRQLYKRFGGVEGAAYLVGGAGITFHRRGSIVLAPIRTGLGVRLGANVGYVKFTPRPSLNPF